jgi:phosphatidylserine/phosphatidylglycerophosphate/cardiolipin synthase-like enzyme
MRASTRYFVAVVLSFAVGFYSAWVMLPAISGAPLEAGDYVVLINDRDYYDAVYRAISDAAVSVHIVMYEIVWYDYDNEVMSLVHLLGSKAESGVEVRVILEYDGDNTSFISENNMKVKEYLESRGAEVLLDSPSVRTHDKLIIVDGEVVIVGSTNWSQSALNKNHEAAVLISDEDVAALYEDYFNSLWNSLTTA